MALPEIQTPRLQLRPWTIDDVDALHALWTSPEVRRYLWDDVVIPRELVQEIVESHLTTSGQRDIGYWVLVVPSARVPIAGFCGFRFIENGVDVELLYGLRGEHWGRGLATEAAQAALDYLWKSTRFERVYGRTDVPNEASQRVLLRLGMTHEFKKESLLTYVLPRPLS